MKRRKEEPSAAEKGALISKLAQFGVTGLTLANFANMKREDLPDELSIILLEAKGETSRNTRTKAKQIAKRGAQ